MHNTHEATSRRALSRPATLTSIVYDSQEEDRRERQELISKLKGIATDLEYSQEIKWHGKIFLEQGSSLEKALQPGAIILRQTLNTAEFKRLASKLRLPEHAVVDITDRGEFNARFDGRSLNFTLTDKLVPALKEEIDLLIELAGQTGGCVTLDEQIDILQWLRFHQFITPQTGADLQTLIAFLEHQFPVNSLLGDYWEMLVAKEEHATALQPAQHSQIRALTRQYIHDQSLLAYLVETILGGRLAPFERSEAESTLLELLSSPIAMIFARGYIRDLDWYGAREDQPTSDEYRRQLLLTAILLDLHPMSAGEESRNHVAGFNLYSAENTEMSFAEVQTKFEKHLIEHCAISEKVVALAAHLLLAGAAPEFLVRDLSPDLVLGTPQWVDYCRAVAVAEINVPGSSRAMSPAQVHALLQFESVSEPQQAIHALASVDPVIDWGLLNSIITLEQVAASLTDSLEVALAAYGRLAQKYVDTAKIMSRPLPTRKDVALDILEQVARGCDFLEKAVLYQHSNKPYQDLFADPMPMSMVELHMSNDLATADWDVKKGTSIYNAFPKMLPNLVPADGEFYRRFHRDYVLHTDAMATHLGLAFSSLPWMDRTSLLRGEITLFTLRPSVATAPPLRTENFLIDPAATLFNVAEEALDKTLKENQKDKDAATGRYGVVICANVDNRLHCYELFTLHGKCRENPQLAKLIEENGLLHTPSREDFSGSLSQFVTASKVLKIPTDIECYTHAVIPGLVDASTGVIEKLAVLPAMANKNAPSRSYYQSFFAGAFNHLVHFVLKHRPIATYDELIKECWGQTRLEKLRATREADLDTFLNIVVPFKSCIEDIASGDRDRQFSGAQSCILEAAMTLLLVVAATAKIISIAARTGSLASKSIQLAKVSAGLLNTLFNPVDGLPQLAKGGVKLLVRGVTGVGRAGHLVLKTATFQMRKLTGSVQSYDLIKAADRATVSQGIWRPAGATGEALTVWASRQDNGWYALNRSREPWGARLYDFDLKFKLPKLHWHKILPKSYTRPVVKEGLSVAKTKIDDAIEVLNDPALVKDSNVALALLLANDSTEARNLYRQYLQEIKTDFANMKSSNFILDNKSATDAVAECHWGLYNDWKTGDKAQNANNQFVRIHVDNFNEAYRMDHFNPKATGDALVHELFHGFPNTKDTVYADHSGIYERGSQQLDVTPLLNLANGQLSQGLPSFPNVRWHPKLAFKNADSFAITTSLLGQLKSNKDMYLQNIATMKSALEKAGYQFIDGPTVVKLNLL